MSMEHKDYQQYDSDDVKSQDRSAPSDLTLARARQSVKKEGGVLMDWYDQDTSERLIMTPQGEQTIYEASAPCNRCGACASVCPSYIAEKKENYSPRGRLQIARLIKEFRIKNPPEALKDAISGCLLCGACEDLCHASIPMPEVALELRRHYMPVKMPFLYRLALRLKLRRIKIYSFWAKLCFLMLKLHLPWFARIFGIAPMLGKTQEEIDSLPFVPPVKNAIDILTEKFAVAPKHTLKWVYFSSCDTNYIMPGIAQATVELLDRHEGEGMLAGNVCCGFLSYRMGNIEEAREFAKENIRIFENLRKKHGNKFIVVTDCSACASFLKKYEQLFIRERLEEDVLAENAETVTVVGGFEEGEQPLPEDNTEQISKSSDSAESDNGQDNDDFSLWRIRAKEFAESVRDISEILNTFDFPKIEACAEAENKKVCYQDACFANNYQHIHGQPLEILKYICGKTFTEFEGSSSCCGGTKGIYIVPQKIKTHSIRQKICSLASVQAEIVISTDPCCIMTLQSRLKKWYPTAKACHFSEYLNDIEKKYKRFG